MKRILICLVFLSTFLFTGCFDIAVGSDSLLNAPSMNKEQSDIYDELKNSVGSNIKLSYPKDGDRRSAFVIENIDDESEKEALIFYVKEDASKKNSAVRVNVMDKINGKWVSVYDLSGEGNSIDKVIVEKSRDNGRLIYLGYNTINTNKSLFVYKYHDKRLDCLYSIPYNYFDMIDMDKSGEKELLTIQDFPDEKKCKAMIYNYTDKAGLTVADTTELGSMFDNYQNISVGKTQDGQNMIVLDSNVDKNKIATEIIVVANQKLYNPLYQFKFDLYEKTQRLSGYKSIDFNRDGIIEIPVTSPFLGYENNQPEEQLYMTDWYTFKKYYTLENKFSSYYNRTDAYVFIIPARWKGFVTVKKDPISDETVFYKFNEDIENSTQELMRIKAVSRNDSHRYYTNGYRLVDTKGQIDYFIKQSRDTEKAFMLSNSEISNSFFVL